MNLRQIAAEWQETYPYRCKKSVYRANNGLGWCDARGILREFQGFDGCIQHRDVTLPPRRLLEFGFHCRSCKSTVWPECCKEGVGTRKLIETSAGFATTRLVRASSFIGQAESQRWHLISLSDRPESPPPVQVPLFIDCWCNGVSSLLSFKLLRLRHILETPTCHVSFTCSPSTHRLSIRIPTHDFRVHDQ